MFYDKFIPQNEIETKFDEIEIDEMYSYITKKRFNLDLEGY